MDIWAWVHEAESSLRKAGHARLADLCGVLPSACCDGEHERVESLVPEALALARNANQPWLEVFIQHWLMQSRVLHRHDVSHGTLKQAVALVELASRPETKDCPQSVCAVQDLCAAYGLVDGVGYAEQRLAVTAEVLPSVEPARSCFDCVSAERASALIDAGRHADALAFCEAQLARRPAHTNGIDNRRVRCLTALGRHAEAERVADRMTNRSSGKSGELTHKLLRCLLAARLGDHERAARELCEARELSVEHYLDWLRCVRELVGTESDRNSWRIERVLADMRETLTRYESHFTLAKVHKIGAELAVRRGARLSAERHLSALASAGERLVRRDWVDAKRRAIEAELAQLPARVGDLAELGDDPERDLEILEAAELDGELDLLLRHASALEALARGEEATRRLEAVWLRRPNDVELTLALLEQLLRRGEHERLAELCAKTDGAARDGAQWVLARSLYAKNEHEQARDCCAQLLASKPQHQPARYMLAMLLREAGELDGALEHLNLLVEANEPGNYDWDRMLTATLSARWDLVRASAARLELPLGDAEAGPIDAPWGACRIRFKLADGRERAYFAWRRGPVTARVDELCAPGEEQHHGDLVAFDAAPLNRAELAAYDEAQQPPERRPLCEYGAYRVLEAGRYRAFEIDGFEPTEPALAELRRALQAVGVVFERRTDERYKLSYDGQLETAIYGFIGLPEERSEADVHQLLLELEARHSLRLVWPKLAAAAGDVTNAANQRQLADDWGIE